MAKARRTVACGSRSAWIIFLTLFSVSLVLTQEGQAQDFSRVEIFGGYSILRPNLPSSIEDDLGGEGTEKIGEFVLGNVLGWGSSVTVNINPNFGVTADFSGHYRSLDAAIDDTKIDASASLHTFLFGPTFAFRGERVQPFVHALFGGGRVNASATVDSDTSDFDETVFAASVGGGVDVVVNPHVSVRAIEFDYFPVRHSNSESTTFNNIRWRSGVVIGF